jgi:hypothetical protein
VPLLEKVNQEDQIIPESDIKNLFGNIEEVKSCSKQLLVRLNSEVAPSIGGKGIGKVFLTMVRQRYIQLIVYQAPMILECFAPYIMHFDKCVETYNRAIKNTAFVEFERECERDPRGSLLSLTDILIMPVQRYHLLFKLIVLIIGRLPRYQLLFEVLEWILKDLSVAVTPCSGIISKEPFIKGSFEMITLQGVTATDRSQYCIGDSIAKVASI